MATSKKTSVTIAAGVALTAGLALSPTANAESNPFASAELSSGYMQLAENATQDKKAEGKCGGDKKNKEGKCGGDKKAKEGKCGGDKKSKEGKCGGDKKAKEGMNDQ